MEKITVTDIPALFAEISRAMEENKALLTDLDANMGDGDLGLTMTKGFGALPAAAGEFCGLDMGKTLEKLGWKLISVIPSTMGTLMGSGLIEGGKAIPGRAEMGPEEFTLFLGGFCKGLIKRGKCAPGDRTVLDAMDEAHRAAAQKLSDSPDVCLQEIVQAAYEGTCRGVEKTRDMAPKFGKAVVHRNKALGTVDQGAVAGKLLIEGIHHFVRR